MRSRLIARTVPVNRLSVADRDRMFALMKEYYDAVSRDQFERDLSKKCAVIVLRDRREKRIRGFSTLLRVRPQGRDGALGIFSGDTIIEREYWGERVLGVEFLKFLWIEKLKNPFRPVYWLLISKGYKTYLMMANNFVEHYPRYECPTPPEKSELMRGFYESLYPGKYDLASSRILFDRCEGKLKDGVACTDPDLIAKFPRIAFFERSNPGWRSGDELACIARMTLWMPLQYQWKVLTKRSAAKSGERSSPASHRRGDHRIERRRRAVPVRVERRSRRLA